jgi:hypothetical protein
MTYEKVKYYYDNHLWSIVRVRNAVTAVNPPITAAQFTEITGQAY